MEHLDVLRLNGFDVEVDENAGLGERVKLTAQPVSRDTVFDVGGEHLPPYPKAAQPDQKLMIRGVPGADLEELVEMIATSGGAEVVRPTKARRMFASRACRKSVMIGKALNHKQMTTVRKRARRSFLRSSAVEALCRKADPATGGDDDTSLHEQILQHMGGMEQPWVRLCLAQQLVRSGPLLTDPRRALAQACPHGRPTMRWVSQVGHRWLSAASREPKSSRKCRPWKGFESVGNMTATEPGTASGRN